MKLITLNAWGGKLYEPLIKFIKDNKDVDFFCLQDVLFGDEPVFSPIKGGRMNLCKEIEKILTDHERIISREENHSFMEGEVLPANVGSGKVIFYKKNFKLVQHGGFDVSDTNLTDTMISSQCQWGEFDTCSTHLTILNLHGMWQKDSKKQDTEERLEQSRRISQFMKGVSGPKILVGDFNIVPDGKSIAILEEGMINLIKEHKIETTRNSYYTRGGKFADYIIISKEVGVNDFKTLPDEVSDHLALYLDFSLT